MGKEMFWGALAILLTYTLFVVLQIFVLQLEKPGALMGWGALAGMAGCLIADTVADYIERKGRMKKW